MSTVQIAGIIFGTIVALVGLISAIICILNYGFENVLTIIFVSVFIVGLLIIGLAWSQ